MADLAARGFSPEAVAHALMVALVNFNVERPTARDLAQALRHPGKLTPN